MEKKHFRKYKSTDDKNSKSEYRGKTYQHNKGQISQDHN